MLGRSAAVIIVLAACLIPGGCASTVTTQLKPQSLQEGAPTAEVTVMSGNATLSKVYCRRPGGRVQALKLVADESTLGAIGKVAFMITPYGWAAMAAHSGKKAIVTLPAGRVDLVISHIQRKEISRHYLSSKLAKIYYRQWSWKQVITADLKADGEYVLQVPGADCLAKVKMAEVEGVILTRCTARLLMDDKPVASAGAPLAAVVADKVEVNQGSTDQPTTAGKDAAQKPIAKDAAQPAGGAKIQKQK